MLRWIAPRDPGRAAGGTSPPLVEQRCIRRVSDGCRGGSHADFAAGGGVLRLWSSGASGGCQADAAADRMLSLLQEEESSGCGAELHPAGIMRMPWRIVC
ncbi:unnamed protein product [Sphagnum jensenii]|uniref:Uncharacterized protein n=1 Tax=Sphagnum jensenii TaxID=128206 RepID=A0ABP1BCS5_9BRYO